MKRSVYLALNKQAIELEACTGVSKEQNKTLGTLE